MGTCKKRPQRDRGPRRAQVPSRCPILFCRHTASAQGPSRRPCLLDKCAVGGCRLPQRTRPRIGNRFGNVRGYRQQTARTTGFGEFPQIAIRPARTTGAGSPPALTRDPPASPERGRRLDMPHGYSWTSQTAEEPGHVARPAASGRSRPTPDADATPERTPLTLARAVTNPIDRTVVDRSVESGKPPTIEPDLGHR